MGTTIALNIPMFTNLARCVMTPPAVGIDISDITIKFLRIGERRGKLAVDYSMEMQMPEGIVVDGEIKREGELVRLIREYLARGEGRRVRERYCIASLPEEKSFVRVVELPVVSQDDLAKAVRWEVEGVIPLPPEEIYYDFEVLPLGESSDHRDVLVTAFPRPIIESYERVLRGVGLTPLAIELESQAISRAVIDTPHLRRASIVIDLGANRTSFIIFAGGSLFFTKSIAVGGRNFEAAIGSALGVGLEEARQAKIAEGLNKNYRGGKAFRALAPHLDAIVKELEQQIWFYREHPAKRHPSYGDIEEVILCGGDANLIGIERYISTAIKHRTVIANPFANLPLESGAVPSIPKSESLKYTTAIGLALRAAGR